MTENAQIEQGDSNINVLYDLNKSKNANDLIRHHRFVQEYYEDFNNNRELNHNFLHGEQYEPDELARFRDKRKVPIVFNQIKTSERTILGLWLSRKYAVRFASEYPGDDDVSEYLERLNIWETEQQQDEYNDIDILRQAWCGGNSFQECYMHIQENKEPKMFTNNQNPFGIYFDPESRKLITREDALFVDRVSWTNLRDVLKINRKKKKSMEEMLDPQYAGDSGYDFTTVYADRDHEELTQRNGSFKVIERFYKVDGTQHYIMDGETKVEIEKEDLKQIKLQYPQLEIMKEDVEFLYLAIVCEAWSNQEYVFNGKYHCQPRDPRTGKILWPVLEMVAESLAGQPQSFVDHERSPNKVINSMMSNIVSSATHAAAAAGLIDVAAFVSEDEAKLAARHHSDSDRMFKVRPGRTADAMGLVPKGNTNQDNTNALNYSQNFLKEVSSTPPSLQGIQESASTPASLNAQRIEQGFNQLQPLMKNWILFIKQRAKLRYAYWRIYYVNEKTFKAFDPSKPDMESSVTINQMTPEMDSVGNWTGLFKKMNDINMAIYTISIEEAVDSPTYRDKQMRFIEAMMGSGFIQADVGLAAGLLEESLRLAEAPKTTKEFLKKYSTLIQQANIAQKQLDAQQAGAQVQGQELQNQQLMQNIAQTEAVQTTPGPAMTPQGGR